MTENPQKPSPFDPSRFRITGASSNADISRKVITAIPVRKPGKQQFVRARNGDNWRIECGLLHLEGDERAYIVDPTVAHLVGQDLKRTQLRLAIDRQGNPFLWIVPLPSSDMAENPWHMSHRQIADMAETCWIRMTSNRAVGAYEAFEATGEIPEPTWPELTVSEILEIAFGKSHVIDDRDHPALRKLRGEL
jgi:hypothetical protein